MLSRFSDRYERTKIKRNVAEFVNTNVKCVTLAGDPDISAFTKLSSELECYPTFIQPHFFHDFMIFSCIRDIQRHYLLNNVQNDFENILL